jgi:hypothetical protein
VWNSPHYWSCSPPTPRAPPIPPWPIKRKRPDCTRIAFSRIILATICRVSAVRGRNHGRSSDRRSKSKVPSKRSLARKSVTQAGVGRRSRDLWNRQDRPPSLYRPLELLGRKLATTNREPVWCLQPESRAAFGVLLDQGWTDAIRAVNPDQPMYTF